jgi:hypothetical protein
MIRLRASCGFDSSAFDATGIVAIVGFSDNVGGTDITLLQYTSRGRALNHRALDPTASIRIAQAHDGSDGRLLREESETRESNDM